jgi:hypothetical protein
MSRKKKNNKISRMDKLTIGAFSMLGLVGGWNIIGNLENSTSAKTIDVEEVVSPTPAVVRPTPKPWPTIQPLTRISRLEIKALPTLAGVSPESGTDSLAQMAGDSEKSFEVPAMSSAAAIPTLAPLPALPEYVPPPPPPPSQSSSNNGGGGGNRSTGS